MGEHPRPNRGKVLGQVARADSWPSAREYRLMTPGQRWKLRRDLVIFLANRQGASQRMLADVFDLPHSRIAAILKNMRIKYESVS